MSPNSIVLVGAGHAHIQVIEQRPFLSQNLRPILICDTTTAVYSGLLPATIANLAPSTHLHVPLRPFCNTCHVHFIHARVVRINPSTKRVYFRLLDASSSSSPLSISYHLLSINVGSSTRPIPLASNPLHASPRATILYTRPIAQLLPALDDLNRSLKPDAKILVIGGGSAGLELTLVLHARFSPILPNLHVTNVTRRRAFARTFGENVEIALRSQLSKRHVHQRVDVTVLSLDDVNGIARLSDDTSIHFDLAVIATGAAPSPLLSNCHLSLHDGYIHVTRSLQSVSHPDVFAAGDCVSFGSLYPQGFPPKAGVFAVRQGPILTHNLVARCNNHSNLRTYVPQHSFLTLVTFGDGSALGSKYGLVFVGTWVFRLKMFIDEQWQNRFRKLCDGDAKKDHEEFSVGDTQFNGNAAEAAAALIFNDEVRTDDSFDVQLSILRRMDTDIDFRASVINIALREETEL